MTVDLPIACTLSAEQLSARVAEIAALGRDALIETDENLTVRLRNDPETRARLAAIIAAESKCCAFLGFDVSESHDELRLTISAPAGGEQVARELVAAFSGRM